MDFSADLGAFSSHCHSHSRSSRFSRSHLGILPAALLFLPFFGFFLIVRGQKWPGPGGQGCNLHHRDGLYNRASGMPNPVSDRLRAGSSVSGGRRRQSARGALLPGAPVAGHRGHGEVLVPLHLPLRNHLFGDWCRGYGRDLQL